MKISEFKSPKKIEEGVMSTLFGGNPLAAARGAISGKGTANILAQDAFIKDFVQDAITSISNGLSGKFIDPKKKMTVAAPQQDIDNGEYEPNNEPKNEPTSAQTPPAQQPGQKMTQQQMNIARTQQRAGVNPTGQRMTPAQMGIARRQQQALKAASKPVPVKEEKSSYHQLNDIFERIMEATDPQTTINSGKPSIGDYVYDWFNQYMSGVNWKVREDQVIPLIQAIEKTYNPVTKAKGAITQLAKVAYALSKAYSTVPRGAMNAAPAKNTTPSLDANTQIATLAKDPKIAAAMKDWVAKHP